MPVSFVSSLPRQTPDSSSRPLDVSIIVLPIFLLGFLLARFAAPIFALLPACAFRAALGFPCPTCGATRAGLALAQGEWLTAFGHNPLFVLCIGILSTWSALRFLEWMSGKSIGENFFQKSFAKKYFKSGEATLRGRQRELRRWVTIAAIVINWLYLIISG